MRERVRSAQARGVVFGRQQGRRVKARQLAPKVLTLVEAVQSYRQIAGRLSIGKNTVVDIVKPAHANEFVVENK